MSISLRLQCISYGVSHPSFGTSSEPGCLGLLPVKENSEGCMIKAIYSLGEGSVYDTRQDNLSA